MSLIFLKNNAKEKGLKGIGYTEDKIGLCDIITIDGGVYGQRRSAE